MHIIFHKGSLEVQSCKDVHHVDIYPTAAEGRGTIHVYDSDGKTAAIILMDTIDNARFWNDLQLTSEQAALTPEPIQPKEEASE